MYCFYLGFPLSLEHRDFLIQQIKCIYHVQRLMSIVNCYLRRSSIRLIVIEVTLQIYLEMTFTVGLLMVIKMKVRC